MTYYMAFRWRVDGGAHLWADSSLDNMLATAVRSYVHVKVATLRSCKVATVRTC